MSEVVEEIGRGGQADEQSNRRRKYAALGYADEGAALAAVVGFIAGQGIITLGGLTLRNVSAVEDTPGNFKCEATWGPFQRRTPPATGESQFNFEIAVQPVKVIVPTGAIRVYQPAGAPTAPTIQLIGDTGDPNNPPEGAEVFEPAHTESETHYIDDAAIVPGYKAAIKSVVGKVNDATFKGHDAGEALLVGVSGSKRGATDWEVTFRWQVKENQSALTIAEVNGIEKKGWEYLWPMTAPKAENGTLRRDIKRICVAPVFRPCSAQRTLAFWGSGRDRTGTRYPPERSAAADHH